MESWNWLTMFPAIQTRLIPSRKQSELLEVGLKASQVPLDNGVLHCFSQTRWMTSPSRHRTGQKTGWKEPDSALPSSVCPKLQAWVVPGACWKERSASGTETTSSRIPSTFTLVGERLEDDEPSFEAAVFKGPAEPLGALLEGAAEPLDAILWGLAEPLEAVLGGSAEALFVSEEHLAD